VTDHLAVLRPDTMMMIGHCGGLRNHQRLGDFVVATAYQRADHVLDGVLPADVPVIPNHRLNTFLLDALDAAEAQYRLGVVHTTDNRNWEFNQGSTLAAMRASRSTAVDMESATIAGNGFRYRIPNATLLCVSDKPLHASPKLSANASAFYETSKRQHLAIALSCLDRVRREHPDGLPSHDIRSVDEPLFEVDATECIRVDEDGAGPARGEVAPAPVNQDLEPITKTDQIDDVHAQPQQPREEPVELQRIPAGASGGWPQWQLGHRVTSAEHGHDPLVAVAEGP
jgi:nucleoside phosphorylase